MAKAMIVTFNDGDIQAYKGDHMTFDSAVLMVGNKDQHDYSTGITRFKPEEWTALPLANIRTFHWGNA